MDYPRIASIKKHSDEKVVIRKPKVMIRRSQVKLGLEKELSQRFPSTITMFNTSYTHFQQKSVVSNPQYARNHPKDSKYRKKHQTAKSWTKNYDKNDFPLLAIQDFSIKSPSGASCAMLPDHCNTSSIRIKKGNFRRLRWTPLRLKSQSCISQIIEKNDGKFEKKHQKNFKFLRRELIPQTKANAVTQSKNSIGELRISGFMKDFTLRDLHTTYKDSADLTDM